MLMICYKVVPKKKEEEVIQLKESGFRLHKQPANCSIKSHENLHETIKHKFTNQVTRKLQENQGQISGDVLTTTENTIPKINRGLLYPRHKTFAKQQLDTKSTDTKNFRCSLKRRYIIN